MISVKKIAQLVGHSGAIYCLEHYKDNRFFSAGFDNVIVEWDLNNMDTAKAIAKLKSKAISILYLSKKNWLVVGQSTGGVHIIDLSTKKEIHLLQAHEDMVFALCYNEESDMLYVGAADGKLSQWHLSTMTSVNVKSFNYGKIREIKLSKGLLHVGFGDGSIVIMTVQLSELLKIQEHMNDFSVNTILVESDKILSGSRDGHLNIVNVEMLSYEMIDRIPAHNYAIYKIVKSPNGLYYATASRDKSIKIWDAQNLRVIKKIDFKSDKGHIASVNDIIWFDNYIVSTGDDKSIMVWELLSE